MASTEGRESRQVKGGAGAPNPPEPDNVQCPRCESTDTKFCYYNNYNLSQPRYMCKSCRRYWTRGGSIRNVPVGGGSRKRPRFHAPPLPPPPIPAVPYSTNTTSSYLNEGLPLSFTALLCSQQDGEYSIGLGSGFGASSSRFDWFGENTWQMEGGGITDGGDWFGLE